MDKLSSQSPSLQQNDEHNRAYIVVGQRVTATKLEFAKKLRQNPTPTEDILWQSLRRNQLNGLKFRRQQIIDGFIVDFYCHSSRLVIEIDGEIHQQQIEYDRHREDVLRARGLSIIRFTNAEVLAHLDRVLSAICDLSPSPSPGRRGGQE